MGSRDCQHKSLRDDALSGKRHLHRSTTLGKRGPAVADRTPVNSSGRDGLDPLLLALDQLLAIESSDAIIRRAIELARDRIGLLRASIYVIDRCRHLMLGTWGSDASGAILDEHHVMYAMSDLDRAAFRPDLE